MPPATSLLSVIEAGLKDMLAPLLGPGGESLRSVTVGEFKGADGIGDVLDQHRTRMPGLILSVPDVAVTQRPDRLLDLRLTYGILIGFADRRDQDARRAFLFTLHDELAARLWLQRIPCVGLPVNSVDVVRPSSVLFAVDAGDGIAALYASFDVPVRGWNINTPALPGR